MSAVPLPRQRATAGFHARTTLDESPADKRMVSMAVARGREGDREAIRFLYVRYSHNIYGYVRSIVHDEHEAEDITQHVFAKLMTVLVKYDERGVPFFGWLLRLAHNAAIDHLRSRRATPAEEIFGADEHSGDDVIDRSHVLREALPAAAEGTVPFVRMDRDDPELLEELLGVVRTVAEGSSFTLGTHVEAF